MKVKRLEDIALEVSYREIVTNLFLCSEHVSHKAENKQLHPCAMFFDIHIPQCD